MRDHRFEARARDFRIPSYTSIKTSTVIVTPGPCESADTGRPDRQEHADIRQHVGDTRDHRERQRALNAA